MPTAKSYQRQDAIEYARKWALSRNPAYYDFHGIGGDCTNFISQCLYAGSHVMNYTKTFGWYYINVNNRAPAWTSVKYLYQFLIRNQTKGVFGEEIELSDAQLGDIIQLAKNNIGFYHSLLITKIDGNIPNLDNISICTHTFDSLDRKLNTYQFDALRCIHILGYYE